LSTSHWATRVGALDPAPAQGGAAAVGSVRGDGGDEVVVRVACRLACLGPPDLDLEQVAFLEALHQHPVHALVQFGQEVVDREPRRLLELAHQRQPAVGGDHHLEGPSLAMAPGVLARMVDVEIVVGVLDHRDAQPAQPQRRDQLFDQVVLPAPE
jgi:hypothetical protein